MWLARMARAEWNSCGQRETAHSVSWTCHPSTPSRLRLNALHCTNFLCTWNPSRRSEVTRVTDSTSSSPDSFKVTLKDRMQYQCMADTTKSATMKNFFSQSVAAVSSSKCVRGVFRWRFERVHACLKIQKPYVLTSKALSLKAKEPVEIA